MKTEVLWDTFDFGWQIGVCVSLGEGETRLRNAIKFHKSEETPEKIVAKLRAFADWVEKHGVK